MREIKIFSKINCKYGGVVHCCINLKKNSKIKNILSSLIGLELSNELGLNLDLIDYIKSN